MYMSAGNTAHNDDQKAESQPYRSVDTFLYWTIVYVKTSDCFVDNGVDIFSDFPTDSPPATHLILYKGRGNKRELQRKVYV